MILTCPKFKKKKKSVTIIKINQLDYLNTIASSISIIFNGLKLAHKVVIT